MKMSLSPQSGHLRRARRPATLLVCVALTATGCTDAQNNQKTIFGAIGGGIVASGACLLARGNALTCAVVGVSGAVIGGVIGHAFDDRDRARHDAAVRQALLDQSRWQPQPDAQVFTAATPADQTEAELEQPAASSPSPLPAPRQRRAVASHAVAATQPVTWQNPDTSNSGQILPLRTFASPDTGQTCKVYSEKYIRDGKQYNDMMQACPKADGSFDIKVLS